MSYPKPTSGGIPLRALAMVLIALAIVFAGLGAMSLSSADSETETAAETSAPATTTSVAVAPQATSARTTTAKPTTTTAAPTTTTSTTPVVDQSTPIRVLNNSLVAGLASRTVNQLKANGWTNATAGNYAGSTIPATTVYYGNSTGDKAAAEAVAAILGAGVAPMIPGLGGGSAGVVVVVTGN
ncbi:LytR C-terminal domain-containing protein [Nocardia cyriacigeorgica]|uniref:LytR C-terminal domain-containing protein n=1 Tax=Nocardia cyriacigeorgica TaxID=135487 RepID=UPI0015E44724|nr:LytR C-terminal domain-containing protein [Nocardia cyriacigeorgica]MBF6085663.1 LytR C-terminal domain-containing protein [Nocardia cyriacigeorgica]MBF6091753.1 LytR C-terminal domain-containing protein [Nocardia cyriacigeorgica]MBF6159623.1 LytR C-terminal domain-containing protein [Nocardia cyriacigeorgica]MBF6198706.1 LytR C-terminal domain-containing protein [Nocardia cyriacigeorgica]MBF6321365.1 LytR C-terminal domain-containing protein [Nocardia cyriacigeorgica]